MPQEFEWFETAKRKPHFNKIYLCVVGGVIAQRHELLWYDKKRKQFYRSDTEWGDIYLKDDEVLYWAEIPPHGVVIEEPTTTWVPHRIKCINGLFAPDDMPYSHYTCENCGFEIDIENKDFSYCPDCGLKVRKT